VSKPAVNIDGLSEATLDFLINKGWVEKFKDVYHLASYATEWKKCDGFGAKSVDKLLDAIEKSRNIKLENFICALSIDGIGKSAAKTIAARFENFKDFIVRASDFNWEELDGIGSQTALKISEFIQINKEDIRELAREFNFEEMQEVEVKENPFTGKTLCVTGKLFNFTRDSINAKITELGAKAASSVSSKTDYLITNEQSGSSKYKKAVELNIPIITENEFLEMIG
jgi:DNA ligase (NAD+)